MNNIDLVFIGLILLGALCGLIRGSKYGRRSLIATALIIGFAFIISAFCTRPLFDLVIPKFNIANLGSLEDLPNYLANNNSEDIRKIGDIFVNQVDNGITNVLTDFGLSVVRIFLFLILVVSLYSVKMILSIVILILRILTYPFRKKKKKSKHRILGAVFGATASAAFALSLLVPVVGFYDISKKALASDFLQDKVGDTTQYFEIIEKSAVIGSVGQSLIPAFDAMTSFSYNNQSFNLRTELSSFIDLILLLEDTNLLNGVGDINSFTPTEMSSLLTAFSELVGALGKQKLITALLPMGLKLGCSFSEDMCNQFAINTIDVSNVDFNVEKNALKEFAAIYNLMAKDLAPNPFHPSHANSEEEPSFIPDIGFGIPDIISESTSNEIIALLNNEVDVKGDPVATPNIANLAINKSVLLNTVVPNLLNLAFTKIIEEIIQDPEFELPTDNVVISNELIGIVTFVSLIDDMDELMSMTDVGEIDTTPLKFALRKLAQLPDSMIRQVVDKIFTAKANELFAGGKQFNYRWENVSVLGNIDAFLALIDMANSLNNAMKDITEMDMSNIEDVLNNLADVIDNPLVGEMLNEMINTVCGENDIPVPDVDYSQIPAEDIRQTADIYQRLKALKELGPDNRDTNELVETAEDLVLDAFALNITFNSRTIIYTSATENAAIMQRMGELLGAGTILISQYNAIAYIFQQTPTA